jgi:hypothetical protein
VDLAHARYAAERIPHAELFVCPAESHLLWFSPSNTVVEEKMRAFLHTTPIAGWPVAVRWAHPFHPSECGMSPVAIVASQPRSGDDRMDSWHLVTISERSLLR